MGKILDQMNQSLMIATAMPYLPSGSDRPHPLPRRGLGEPNQNSHLRAWSGSLLQSEVETTGTEVVKNCFDLEFLTAFIDTLH